MTTQKPSAESLNEAAARWAARLDAGPLSKTEEAALEAWLSCDVRALGAFARAEAALTGSGQDDSLAVPPLPSRRWVLGGAVVGTAAAACITVVLSGRSTASPRRFSSEIGEIRHVPLEDGSYLTLNTDTVLDVRYTPEQRRIHLLRGEAFFEVAKDATRPFIVMGPNAQIRTVGTTYAVRLTPSDEMRVLVASGRVAIETISDSSGALFALKRWAFASDDAKDVFVDAGQEVSVRRGIGGGLLVAVASLPKDAPAHALAWREGQIYLEGQTLAEAVAEFARYSRRRLTIGDDALAKMHVTGLFAATDPEGFARAVALSLGARVAVDADGILIAR